MLPQLRLVIPIGLNMTTTPQRHLSHEDAWTPANDNEGEEPSLSFYAFSHDPINLSEDIGQKTPTEKAKEFRVSASQGGGIDAARKAVDILREALSATPNDANLLNQQGLSYFALGEMTLSPKDMKEACDAFDTAIEVGRQENEDAFCYRVIINKAAALRILASYTGDDTLRVRSLDEAERLLNEILGILDPQDGGHQTVVGTSMIPSLLKEQDIPRAYDNRGNVFLDQGKYERAIDDFIKARDAWRNECERARTVCNLGTAYLRLGRYQDAIKALDHVLAGQHQKNGSLAWGRTQVLRCQSLSLYGDDFYSSDPQRAVNLYNEAAVQLSLIRTTISEKSSPALWSLATSELGSIYQKTGRYIDALFLYAQSYRFLCKRDGDILRPRLILVSMLSMGMSSKDDLISAVKVALTAHGVPQSDWAATLTEIMSHIVSSGHAVIDPEKGALPTAKLPLPEKARIKYSDRTSDPRLAQLNIIDFLRIEYGPWLDGALTRKHLRELDISASRAVDNWIFQKRCPLPDDIKLPTRQEVNDRAIVETGVGKAIASSPNLAKVIGTRLRRKKHIPDM